MENEMPFTPEQRASLDRVFKELTARFSGLSPAELVAGPLAEAAFGPLPPYSNLQTHKVTNVATAMVGAFVFCYGRHPFSGTLCVAIVKRGDKGPNGEDRFGATGGFTNLDFTEASTYTAPTSIGEQPAVGACREVREELLDDHGVPILDLDPARLVLLKTGLDYRGVEKGRLPTQYNGHMAELTAPEILRLLTHVERLASDQGYRDAARLKANGEIADVMFLPLSTAAALDETSFTHPHEHATLRLLIARLCDAPRPCCADKAGSCAGPSIA
jgi:hypothetical protein